MTDGMCIVPFSVLHACKFAYLQALTLVFQRESAQLVVLLGGQLDPDQLAYDTKDAHRVQGDHRTNIYCICYLWGCAYFVCCCTYS